MKRALKRAQDSAPAWIRPNGWANGNTIKALKRRGLIDVCHRPYAGPFADPNTGGRPSPRDVVKWWCLHLDTWYRLRETPAADPAQEDHGGDQ